MRFPTLATGQATKTVAPPQFIVLQEEIISRKPVEL